MEWFELLKVFFSFVLAAVLSYYLTPRVREAAISFGILDKPDGNLKKQEEAVPYLGGWQSSCHSWPLPALPTHSTRLRWAFFSVHR
jgi:UDP-N-acetylmuramyl pentapeptide phosphotransferase/UDP-N-acetylglucosamine-1-phosphate transferase